ncbi:MAG: AAA family ATPase [Propionivibrio sp.]|nr:AAA family ATPase [Propionivibrio sp.]
MQVARIEIYNFRGIKEAALDLGQHVVLLGDNNTGKTTVLEAMDLALGPDRLNRTPPVDEHDFFLGRYLPESAAEAEAIEFGDGEGDQTGDVQQVAAGQAPDEGVPATEEQAAVAGAPDVEPATSAPQIRIEVTIANLSEEQQGRFGDYIEFWDSKTKKLYQDPAPEGVDAATVSPALRVTFIGQYDPEEDDFEGKTFYTLTLSDSFPVPFTKKDKQVCGFLYLRSVRTGSRALSLERGSLLDIILRLKEVRPQM